MPGKSREAIRKARAKHYKENRESIKKKVDDWRQANPERVKEYRRNYNANRVHKGFAVRDVVSAQSRVRAAVKSVSETTPGAAARLKAARTVLKRTR